MTAERPTLNAEGPRRLALPPPRETLLVTTRAQLQKIHAQALTLPRPNRFLWCSYYAALVRAEAYEATLLPSEKDRARWQELRCRAAMVEGFIKHAQEDAA